VGRQVGALPGQLVVTDDIPGEFTERVVESFLARPNSHFSVALSGGETARRCYERLADQGGHQIDWWQVDVYWGDERCVPPDDPASNCRLAHEALLDRVGAANATYPMRGEEGPEPYELLVAELGRFNLVHLGMGADGHTASLFPGSPALELPPERLVALNEDRTGRNPHPRMTLTFAGISRGRLVLVTVSGEEKKDALARVIEGEDLPAAHIRGEKVVWLVDPAAAGRYA
jgi:6-phosphogluconolactonase